MLPRMRRKGIVIALLIVAPFGFCIICGVLYILCK